MTSREYTIKVGQELVEKSSKSFDEKNPLTVETQKPVKFVGLAQTTTILKNDPLLEKKGHPCQDMSKLFFKQLKRNHVPE